MNEDRNAPATKGDLYDLEARLEGKLDAVEQRMLDAIKAIVHESETRLLTAFHGYANNNDKRIQEVESNETFLRGRIAVLESRITEVERRLNLPPQSTQ
jgi:hypothetical protein